MKRTHALIAAVLALGISSSPASAAPLVEHQPASLVLAAPAAVDDVAPAIAAVTIARSLDASTPATSPTAISSPTTPAPSGATDAAPAEGDGPSQQAVAVLVDIDDPTGMLSFAYDAITDGNWGWAAIALSILLTYAIRRWPHLLKYIGLGAASDWIGTAKGGIVLAGVWSFGGWALHSAVDAGGWPTTDGLDVALGALIGSLAVLLPSKPKGKAKKG